LAYFGVYMSQDAIANRYIPTQSVPFSDQVAVIPEDLHSGLERILDEHRTSNHSWTTLPRLETDFSSGSAFWTSTVNPFPPYVPGTLIRFSSR
jgi:hypothetical protein